MEETMVNEAVEAAEVVQEVVPEVIAEQNTLKDVAVVALTLGISGITAYGCVKLVKWIANKATAKKVVPAVQEESKEAPTVEVTDTKNLN